MEEDGYDKCITALKLLRDNMEKTRRFTPFSKKHDENIYFVGWNACIDRFRGLIDEMIGDGDAE